MEEVGRVGEKEKTRKGRGSSGAGLYSIGIVERDHGDVQTGRNVSNECTISAT